MGGDSGDTILCKVTHTGLYPQSNLRACVDPDPTTSFSSSEDGGGDGVPRSLPHPRKWGEQPVREKKRPNAARGFEEVDRPRAMGGGWGGSAAGGRAERGGVEGHALSVRSRTHTHTHPLTHSLIPSLSHTHALSLSLSDTTHNFEQEAITAADKDLEEKTKVRTPPLLFSS